MGLDVYTMLYRPVDSEELKLIADEDWESFPVRLPGQQVFHPIMNKDYAVQIARELSLKHREDGKAYVTKFKVRRDYLDRTEKQSVGGKFYEEYWVPVEDLAEFNANIVGKIEVTHSFAKDD